MELAALPYRERAFWTSRGNMLGRAEAEAQAQDDIDRGIDNWAKQRSGGPMGIGGL